MIARHKFNNDVYLANYCIRTEIKKIKMNELNNYIV
jgi:hypothetical protein